MTPIAPDRNNRITRAARLYQQNLCDKTIIFIYGKPDAPQMLEVEFRSGNFVHLVGIEPLRHSDGGMKSSGLYARALAGEINSNNYTFTRSSEYCDLKLEVFGRVVHIDVNARMIGDFQDGHFVNLSTDKVVGRQNAVLGVVEVGDVFVPNTVINTDILEVAREPQRVLATMKKDSSTLAPYRELRYIAKSLTNPQVDALRKTLKHQGVFDEKMNDPCVINIDTKNPSNNNVVNATPKSDAKTVSRAAKTKMSSAPRRQGRA